MALGNGEAVGGMVAPSTDFTEFTIGGQKHRVPALNLFVLTQIRDDLLSLGPDLHFIDYAERVINIVVASKIPSDFVARALLKEELMKSCSVPEMRELPITLNELLGISGFEMNAGGESPVGEAEAATESPGTGTLTPSPQTSPRTEFAPATSTGSNNPIR